MGRARVSEGHFWCGFCSFSPDPVPEGLAPDALADHIGGPLTIRLLLFRRQQQQQRESQNISVE